MIGGVQLRRQDWRTHFTSPILERLEYWRALNEQRAIYQSKTNANAQIMVAAIDALEQRHQSVFRPRIVRPEGDDAA